MIITGFGSDINGNAIVKIANNNQTQKFSIQINQPGFGQCRHYRNCHLWLIPDSAKELIETEIRNYIRKFGTTRQKLIVEYC